MLHSICQQFGKPSSGHKTGKGQFSSEFQRKAVLKNVQTIRQLCSLPWASKVTLKILQGTLQPYLNQELPDVQDEFRKGRGTRDQIANIHWIIEKPREFQKNIYLFHWLHRSLWLCGSQQTVENSSRDGNTRSPYLPLEKPVCRSRSNS